MIITYFRSSSYNAYSLCEMQYFFTYVLGLPQPVGKSAEQGTIVHKVFECLANAKKCQQEGKHEFEDDTLGTIKVDYDYMYGQAFVQWLLDRVYEYYTERSTHTYWPRDRKKCLVGLANVLQKGDFDPRNLTVIEAEPHFDFPIGEDWAHYEYELPNGEKLEGQLRIKGTIDLVTLSNPDSYEIIDWKTGQQKNWATGKAKDFSSLCVDPQLRIYHFAASLMYPNIKHCTMTIHYVNFDGPFTMAYGPDDIAQTKETGNHTG